MTDPTPATSLDAQQRSNTPTSNPSLPHYPVPPPLPPPFSLRPEEQKVLESGDHLSRARIGRRSKFSEEEDLVLIREVAAAKAHVARNGEIRERFEIAAAKVNASKQLRTQDSSKAVQDRFDRYDRMESKWSGVGGDVGEAEELLSSMREARADFEKTREEKRKKVVDAEERKERLRAVIRQRATQRGMVAEATVYGAVVDEGGDECAHESGEGSAKKRRITADASGFDDEVAAFTVALQKGDERRSELDEQRLALERERFEQAKIEREQARIERLEERKASHELELQKFRLMMDVLTKAKTSAEDKTQPE